LLKYNVSLDNSYRHWSTVTIQFGLMNVTISLTAEVQKL